jgi:hypothetical protein
VGEEGREIAALGRVGGSGGFPGSRIGTPGEGRVVTDQMLLVQRTAMVLQPTNLLVFIVLLCTLMFERT